MTCREESNQVWKHEYNAENRISAVKKMDGTGCSSQGSPTDTWTFTYDGDGVRVMEEYSGTGSSYTKHFFAGGAYEVTVDHLPEPDETTTKKYYNFAGMMVAMHDGSELLYFANDHLSSTSIVMNASGALLSHNRYMPFGQIRDITGDADPIDETDFGYTGQRNLAGMGLMDYRARFYSPLLGRFTQPDSIVPNPTNPQSWNRYSYVFNSPIIYNDPSGHTLCGFRECNTYIDSPVSMYYIENWFAENYGISFRERWEEEEKIQVLEAVMDVGDALSELSDGNLNRAEAFKTSYGGDLKFSRDYSSNPGQAGYYNSASNTITLYEYYLVGHTEVFWMENIRLIVHELGHAFDYSHGLQPSAAINNSLLRPMIDGIIDHGYGWSPNWYYGYAGPYGTTGAWQFGFTGDQRREEFADMFVGWVYNNFDSHPESLGPRRHDEINRIMSSYAPQEIFPNE